MKIFWIIGFILVTSILGANISDAEILFSDDFESDLSKWSYVMPKVEIVGSPSPVHGGTHSLHIWYDVAAGPPAHWDDNQFVQVNMTSYNLDHFFVRGYFYLASTATPTNQRKLFYIWDELQTSPEWNIIVSAWGGIGETPLSLALCSNFYPTYSDLSWPIWDIASGEISYDTWYLLELEIKLNSAPGVKDGEARLWLNGNLESESTGISIRNDLKHVGTVRFGAQIDRGDDELVRHEDRYWDDVAIGTSYIGSSSTANAILGTGTPNATVGSGSGNWVLQ